MKQNSASPVPNALINESSLYLQQHAYNPVSWLPWSPASLQQAKENNRLILISIGYSACHWCHVMERESFEDKTVAAIMNSAYVSIKVDREERPDLDQVYMQASYIVNGSGGWPLNVIALPDGRPVYAGTYFPKEKWIQVLKYFSELYRSQPEMLEHHAAEIKNEMQSSLQQAFQSENNHSSSQDIRHAATAILQSIDKERGGLAGAPKFPMPSVFRFLLDYHYYSKDDTALQAVLTTLDQMAAGGIYDHLEGGFFRYSTDAGWLVPHFEKMLYDNAQLISLYAGAFRLTKNPLYAKVVRQSLSFVQNNFERREGGFFSALDADSEGQEGRYYTWSSEETDRIAGRYAPFTREYYSISEAGNWEDGRNILHLRPGQANRQKLPDIVNQNLLSARKKRVSPALDTKIITSWNALMVIALLDAFRALGDQSFLDRAYTHAHFLEERMIDGDDLYRIYSEGRARIHGFLDDYAFLAGAYIDLYQLSLDEKWLKLALKLTRSALGHFHDPGNKLFYYNAAKDHDLAVRPLESDDNVMPSSAAVMTANLLALGRYYSLPEFEDIASDMLSAISERVVNKAVFHAYWARVMLVKSVSYTEISTLGSNALNLNHALQKHYLPGILFSGEKKVGTFSQFGYKYNRGKPQIIVCSDRACQPPAETPEEALDLLKKLHSVL